ncbi:RrF2 family transcriptional regulator [Ferroacidibacillus organovorans]|uniref:Rrf2 family transcriptional regulator n=1 Tax=Ferroacidibacillus organovorans TaxID=1765683 RepID=A0A101XTK4_9BACL|nr:Rrf2 family transcriptional regulator [Ferroacidibacillus organovorans]KUO97211.1 Rrf2 family transcriptional regulator [Ferroacidibacillus organovorans]
MKISTKGRYGLLLMVDLAVSGVSGPVSLKSVAERKGLSDHYLEQLIAPLRNAGMVKSVRGAYGGYTLARSPEAITAGDVLHVLEGPIAIVDETGDGLEAFWLSLQDKIDEVLRTTTIADLVELYGKDSKNGYMFYI